MIETYHSLEELLIMADRDSVSPGIIACRVEAEESGSTVENVWNRMKRMLPVFRESVQKGLKDTGKSASGLVGGDASRLYNGSLRFLSPINRKAASYALAIAEANAKMYRIVACPTAGSCGILPAVILAVGEESHSSDDELTRALFTAAGFGKVVAEKHRLPERWADARRNAELPVPWPQRQESICFVEAMRKWPMPLLLL